MMKCFRVIVSVFFLMEIFIGLPLAQEEPSGVSTVPEEVATVDQQEGPLNQTETSPQYTIFDDKTLLDGYTKKYETEPKDILIAMMKDDSLSSYKSAAAVRVFKQRFAGEVFSREKSIIERILLRRLSRTDSTFAQVEIMHTLVMVDRYKYFTSMVPALIQKLDHYNEAVNELAYADLNNIIQTGHNRTREARIVFNTLRKVLFLSHKRIANLKEPNAKLKQKFELLRWSIKVLGSQEIKRLPKEVINLL